MKKAKTLFNNPDEPLEDGVAFGSVKNKLVK